VYEYSLMAGAGIRNGKMTLFGNLRYVIFRDTDAINRSGDDVDLEVLYTAWAIMFNQIWPHNAGAGDIACT